MNNIESTILLSTKAVQEKRTRIAELQHEIAEEQAMLIAFLVENNATDFLQLNQTLVNKVIRHYRRRA